ncbi:hypothetical protein G5I_12680 [Acromyrmex echinatior]|uniref:Uncharacterized protein n=1 Tax=Acromyrmex echinatior TaxID=103372 RepID=F4X2Z5_ACREC|nr:hypothetical protein G5I_12680 [Acromyrmex echinatior]
MSRTTAPTHSNKRVGMTQSNVSSISMKFSHGMQKIRVQLPVEVLCSVLLSVIHHSYSVREKVRLEEMRVHVGIILVYSDTFYLDPPLPDQIYLPPFAEMRGWLGALDTSWLGRLGTYPNLGGLQTSPTEVLDLKAVAGRTGTSRKRPTGELYTGSTRLRTGASVRGTEDRKLVHWEHPALMNNNSQLDLAVASHWEVFQGILSGHHPIKLVLDLAIGDMQNFRKLCSH